jgi:tellurite methyltransferase
MNKTYWEEYYKSRGAIEEPSLFAQYIHENYLKEGSSLIELGCGNGRDSIFFAHNGVNTLAVDQCENDAVSLEEKSAGLPMKFIAGDFTNLGTEDTFDAVYSRFTLHSISEEEEDRVIAWAHNNLNEAGHLFIEARGHKNELFEVGEKVSDQNHAYIHNDHYRRFIHVDTLVAKLDSLGFTVLHNEEGTGFAPLGDTDDTFFRVIATKK